MEAKHQPEDEHVRQCRRFGQLHLGRTVAAFAALRAGETLYPGFHSLPLRQRFARAPIVRNGWWSQEVIATHASKRSAGVSKPSVLRGRPLSCRAISSNRSCECTARFVPLGKYWRSKPLVFSLEPRCHGLCGSQKYTATSVASVNRLCCAISLPRSHVSDLMSSSGTRLAQTPISNGSWSGLRGESTFVSTHPEVVP